MNPIPDRDECLRRMNEMQMPEHIRRHSHLVAAIAVYLGKLLDQNGTRLDLCLVEAGALLHDIGKSRALATGQRHEELGAEIVQRWGYHPIAPIVREHVHLEREELHGPITESLLVNYADKRVKHDEIVSLEERFRDLVNRYGRTPKHIEFLEKKYHLFNQLERKIFEHLPIHPEEGGLMNLVVNA